MSEEKISLKESTFAEWIPRLVALTAVGSAVAYGVGWLRVRYYAVAMGVAWYLPSVSQQAIASEGDWRLLFLNGDTALFIRPAELRSPKVRTVIKVTEGGVRITTP